MKILVISDLHGDFRLAVRACEEFNPICCYAVVTGGMRIGVAEADLDRLPRICTVLSTFGNHDPLDLLARIITAMVPRCCSAKAERRNVRAWPRRHRRHLGQVTPAAALRHR